MNIATAIKHPPDEPPPSWFARASNSGKAAAGIVITIGAIIGSFVAADERYAHAADLKQLGLQVEISQLETRRSSLSDKVFDLQQKKKTAAEQASLSRYDLELKDVTRQLSQKRELLDLIKAGK